MHVLTDAFATADQLRALAGALIAATIAALVGTWVVVRGLAFFGDALAHGVLPGVALAGLWGFNATAGAAVSALAMVLGVNLIHRSSRLSDDTGIGLLFVGMLAVGVMLLSGEDEHGDELTAFLFGDVQAVTTTVIVVGLVVLVLTSASLVVGHRAFTALSLDRDKAASLGLRPGLAHAAMMLLLAVSVVVSFRIVGTLLVFGFLVAPAATAILVVRRLPRTMVMAVVFAWSAVIVGLVVSHSADSAPSATVAAISVGQFFTVLAAVSLRDRGRRRAHVAVAV